MLHPTMLGDVGPTCWLRLNRPLHVKNCVLYIDISVEFAFDSCVKKFVNFLKVETQQKMTETRSQNLTAIHRFSVKFRGGICCFKHFA